MNDAVKLRQQLGKLPKWKPCEPDKVDGFWVKEFTNIHEKMVRHLNKCLENGTRKIPEWLAKGRTCLILKDEKKGNERSSFRPITCLPTMWMVFKAMLADQVYGHMERETFRMNRMAAEGRIGEPKISNYK